MELTTMMIEPLLKAFFTCKGRYLKARTAEEKVSILQVSDRILDGLANMVLQDCVRGDAQFYDFLRAVHALDDSPEPENLGELVDELKRMSRESRNHIPAPVFPDAEQDGNMTVGYQYRGEKEVPGRARRIRCNGVQSDRDELREALDGAVNELCCACGKYKRDFLGACDGCKWLRVKEQVLL